MYSQIYVDDLFYSLSFCICGFLLSLAVIESNYSLTLIFLDSLHRNFFIVITFNNYYNVVISI